MGSKIRIGDHEIDEKTQEEINSIVSEFLGTKSSVAEIVPPRVGRSRYGNHYRLTADRRHVSIKRVYGRGQGIRWEVFHAGMRELLGLPHYKLE